MQSQLCFFVSIAFSFMAWGIVTYRYIWPQSICAGDRSSALDHSITRNGSGEMVHLCETESGCSVSFR